MARGKSQPELGLPANQLNLDVTDDSETSALLGPSVSVRENGSANIHVAGSPGSNDDGWDGMKDFEGLPWWRKPSVYWLLAPYSLFTLAFGSALVPKINLIIELVCKQYFADQAHSHPDLLIAPVIPGADNPQCKGADVMSHVSLFMLAMTLCTGLFSLIVAPKVGHLSDRYGRRRLLALASCGGLLNEAVTILAAKFPDTVNYRWLVLGATFDGMGGSFTAANILIQAYTSDCTAPSRRAVSMGFVHTCLFIGLAGGQLLGGYITKWSGSLLTVFYICIICHALFVAFVGFVAPESVSSRKRAVAKELHVKETQQFVERYGSSWIAVARASNPFAPLQYLYPTGPGTSTRLRINLAALAFCDMVILGSAMAAGQVIILYTEHMFLWGNFEASRFIAAISSVRVVVLMGIFPLVNYLFRILPRRRERQRTGIIPADKNAGADKLDIWVLRIALLSDILGNVGNVFARTPQLFLANAMVTALAGLGSATSQSAITKHVPESRVGRILGAVGMLQALMRLAGPLLFNSLFAKTVDSFPQAIFVGLSSMFGAAFLASLVLKPHVAWHDVEEEETERLTDAQLAFNTRGDPPLDEDEIRI